VSLLLSEFQALSPGSDARSIVARGNLIVAMIHKSGTVSDVVSFPRGSGQIFFNEQDENMGGASGPPALASRGSDLVWLRQAQGSNLNVIVEDAEQSRNTFAASSSFPNCLAMTDEDLWWVETNRQVARLDRTNLGGGSVNATTLTANCVAVTADATDAVFATNDGVVRWVGRSGSQGLEVGAVTGVALDDAFVYVVSDTAISRVRRDATGLTTILAINNGCGIAVDDTHIFWAECGLAAAGRVLRIAKPAP
jgi:hypothetical protein